MEPSVEVFGMADAVVEESGSGKGCHAEVHQLGVVTQSFLTPKSTDMVLQVRRKCTLDVFRQSFDFISQEN